MGANISSMDESQLKDLFDEIDRNRNGVIEPSDLIRILEKYGIPDVSEKKVEELIKLSNLDQQTSVDFESFKRIVKIGQFWLTYGHAGDAGTLFNFNSFNSQVWKVLLAGGMAGAISRSSVAPFERLKIIFQTQGDPPKYNGVVRSLVKIFKEEGFKGFFKGNGTNVIRIFPTSAIQFFAFDSFKKILYGDDLNVYQRLVAGSLAGVTAQTICYPLDFVRARLSIQTENVYKGIVDCTSKVVKQEGVFALYRGLWPSLLGIVPYVGIDFAAYETLKQYLPRRQDGTVSPISTFAAGSAAGTIAQTIAYPLDVVRRRLQVQSFDMSGIGKREIYSGTLDAFAKIYKHEGYKGFYRGLVPNYLKVVPAQGVQFFVWEWMRSHLDLNKK
eukprot:TRINITY_DN7933_c0_g1_i1.p1 TRINITY_DN7933_c0_g1~~TRINITY_DN7933_c0_g1_i1.p1  ORF type:complete len:396 (-),score=143.92 TRINITY_DN7933_c0_g1_i1:101-1258(-)